MYEVNLSTVFTSFEPMTVKRRKIEMYSAPLTFDTETSHNHDENNPRAWVYSWAICLDASREIALFGRNVVEFVDALKFIDEYLEKLSIKFHAVYKCIVYAHNLPYDYCYTFKFIQRAFNIKREFFLDRRHILQAEIGEHIILRDSLKYFNMSLEKCCNTYDVKHKKLVGVVDYSAIHHTLDELETSDVLYQLNDVFGLQECLLADMKSNNYSIINIPLTSTGKIRNDCRIHAYATANYREEFIQTRPTPRQFKIMRKVFCGGYCHGNRFYRGKTVFDYIKHRDFRSHYPSIMRKYTFPSGKIRELKRPTLADFFRDGFNTWGMVGFVNLRLKDTRNPAPYLSRSKCESTTAIYTLDNGRVLEIDGRAVTYVTEYDLYIIINQYDYDEIQILRAFQCVSRPLPEWFISIIDKNYKLKSDLKKRVHDLKKANASRDEIYEAEIDLMKCKNFLNGLYGLCALDYCRPDFERADNGDVIANNVINYQYKIDKNYGVYRSKQNKNKFFISNTSSGFLNYAWALYITACARYELYKCIEIAGENFLYADTDSIYYIYSEDIEHKFDVLNANKYDEAIEHGRYIVSNDGEAVTYDSFDLEDSGTEFRFLHSKCYAYKTRNDLKVTISGVASRRLESVDENGKAHYFYNSDELGTIKNLRDGFVFKKCGSTKVCYIQSENVGLMDTGDGVTEYVGDMAIISDNEKTLSTGDDDFIKNWYLELIEKGVWHC